MTKISNPMELPDGTFPKDAFPNTFVEIMDQYHEKLNLNYDFLGTSIIYALSLAIGNSLKLQVKRKWVETPVIWGVIVGSAGVNKSAPLDVAVDPFKNLDKEYFKHYGEELEKFQKNQAKRGNKKENNETANYLKQPNRKQCLITDFTPEALSEAHEKNIRGIGIYADELLLWINNFNRYTKSGEEQFYLSIWSGKEININRRSAPHYYLPYPFIPVVGTIQPYKLAEAFGKGKDKSGFTHRMLFAFPDFVIREELPDEDIPEIYINTYSNIIKRIMGLSEKAIINGEVKPVIICLSEQANGLFKSWRNMNNKRINEGTDEEEKGIYSKIEIYLIRLSLILQVVDDTCNNISTSEVSVDAFENAIKLVKYYEWTALKVYRLISRFSDPMANYSMDKRVIYAALPVEFNTAKGLEVASQFNMPERTFKYFLNDTYLFEKQRHGIHLKKV